MQAKNTCNFYQKYKLALPLLYSEYVNRVQYVLIHNNSSLEYLKQSFNKKYSYTQL